MSTTQVSAGQIMDRVANLLNDSNKTDYTYKVMTPYLNMAIEEFSDIMAEANAPLTNMTSYHYTIVPIIVRKPLNFIAYPEYFSSNPSIAHLPPELIEVQEVEERVYTGWTVDPASPQAESTKFGTWRKLPRVEFVTPRPVTNSLQYWAWENSTIRVNEASVDMEVSIKYIYQGVNYVADENSLIVMVGARTYLAYKTAALCAMFIGENETRAAVLEGEAEKAVDRAIAIGNKGKQQIVTRHRPFRAAWKARGGF